MKRMHVSLSVKNVEQSIQFYTHLFASHPTVRCGDYAKWLLDDPRVNFSIIGPSDAPGLNHLGIQTESEEELSQLHARMQNTKGPVSEVADATCCYAQGKKGWASDPQGVAWEGFFTEHDGLTHFGNVPPVEMTPAIKEQSGPQKACCG